MRGAAAFALAYLACQAVGPSSPMASVEALLSADRAYSAKAAGVDVAAALVPMFADDVLLQVPGAPFAEGRAQAEAALRANPDNDKSRLRWTPLRGGVSADAHHGFTVGYMVLTNPKGEDVPVKYLAYWIKGASGWRVAVYKRSRAPQPPPSLEMLAPSLPSRIVPVRTDVSAVQALVADLIKAEKTFSDTAQQIGLGPAFARFGHADAINLGPGPAVLVGAQAIGADIGAGAPGPTSPLEWSADRAIVASSGDFGVTIGAIRQKAPRPDGTLAPPIPFFTIWRRAGPSAPWRYIAE